MLVPACDPLELRSMYQRVEGHNNQYNHHSTFSTFYIVSKRISKSNYSFASFFLILVDSEDSDGEGGLGNVSRVIIRPPGHSGKAKRGHLCFDAAFETGNLGRADLVGEFEYDLFLRPDTCNPRHRFWFNFTVDNVKQDQVTEIGFLDYI